MAKRVAEEHFDDKEFVTIRQGVEKVVPLGRAKTFVPSEKWDCKNKCCASWNQSLTGSSISKI